MNRQTVRDESGSLPLVLLMVVTITGLLAATFSLVHNSTQTVASNRAFTRAIQIADAGVSQALRFINLAGPGDTSLSSADAEAAGASTSLDGVTFSWSASYVEPEWQITASATVDGRTRTIEAVARQTTRFFVGAFADDRFELQGNNYSDSYPREDNGTVGSNGDVIVQEGTKPEVVVLAGDDAECWKNKSTSSPCPDDVDLQSSERVDVDVLAAQIERELLQLKADLANGEPGASDTCIESPVSVVITDANKAEYESGGTFCFNDLAIDTDFTPTADTVFYVEGDFSVTQQAAEINCPGCDSTSEPDADRLIVNVLGDAVSIRNGVYLAAGIAAPKAVCKPFTSGAQTDIFGSIICNAFSNQGGWAFHFDVRLFNRGFGAYDLAEWREEVGGSTSHS